MEEKKPLTITSAVDGGINLADTAQNIGDGESPDMLNFWRHNGKLITFAQCFIQERYFIDYYLGFDYSVSHQYNLYLVRFKRLLEWCIENNMKAYEIGQSSYEVKRRLGFEFLPLYMYVRPRNKIWAFVSKFYHRYLTFERFEPAVKVAGHGAGGN